MTDFPVVRLKPDEENRIRTGHLWVFSNELNGIPKDIAPGSLVEVQTSGHEFVGIGAYNPHSLIAVRLLTCRKEPVALDFFVSRVEKALKKRKELLPGASSYRLIFAESDGLPGLVVDGYEQHLVVQSHSLGTDAWLPTALEALKKVIAPQGILLRNDSSLRDLEQLTKEVRAAAGDVPKTLTIRQNGARFLVNPWTGHKTGFYLDQSENRSAVMKYMKGARCLDAFCYTGSFAALSALAGAREVIGVDGSQEAIDLAAQNAKLNEVGDRCRFFCSDVFDFLEADKSMYDVILLDPPSFVKNKRQLKAGLKGYVKLNSLALSRLSKDGILVSSSCSHHVEAPLFRDVLKAASLKAGKTLWLLEWRSQGRDHPILLSMPETEYLKFAVLAAQ
jgi:23S rRNA (cytosine1962-C5)-methyltransferase